MSDTDKPAATRGQTLGPDEAFQLARRHHLGGNVKAARDLYQKILKATPDHADSLHQLGLIAHAEGDNQKALQMLRRAAQLQPEQVVHHTAIGLLYQRLNQIYDAENALRRAAQLAERDARVQLNLGVVLQIQERWTEAEAAYRKALEIDPEYADAHNNLGTVLHKQEQFEGAEKAYRQAIELTPSDAELHYNLGNLLRQRGEPDQAAEALQRCLDLDEKHLRAYQQLARVRQSQQRIDEAEMLYEKAIALNPDYIDAYLGLASVHGFTARDPVMRRLQQLVKRTPPGDDQDALLTVEARAHEKLQQYGKAFACYRRIMDRTAKLRPYDAEAHRRFVDRVKQTFSKPENRAAEGTGQPAPIFVIGMSRSGKTLVESLLARHPSVHPRGELHAWTEALQQVTAARNLTDRFPEMMKSADDELFADLGRHYRRSLADLAPDARYVVNTIPVTYPFVGLIRQCLPDARIIFCRRHNALDHCLFVYFKRYTTGNAHAFDLESLGAYYLEYHELLDHWEVLYGPEILSLTYEELVRSPQSAAAALYGHCDLYAGETVGDEVDFHSEEIGYSANFAKELEPLRAVLERGRSAP